MATNFQGNQKWKEDDFNAFTLQVVQVPKNVDCTVECCLEIHAEKNLFPKVDKLFSDLTWQDFNKTGAHMAFLFNMYSVPYQGKKYS